MSQVNNATEALASRYADIFISKFQDIDMENPGSWIRCSSHAQQNLEGKPYRGMNRLILSMAASDMGYGLPLWMTFNQAKSYGVSVVNGSRSMPVVFYDVFIRDAETHERVDISVDDFRCMPADKRKGLEKIVRTQWYSVFNVDQTNFAEVYPELINDLRSHFSEENSFHHNCEILDSMVSNQSWDCPIEITDKSPAYIESYDKIVIGDKNSFGNDRQWYSVLLHLMAHSTGCSERLDRSLGSSDLELYAKEELVAELGSAICCGLFGIDASLSTENLKFLKGWIQTIQEDPRYIYNVMREATQASNFISDSLGLSQDKCLDVSSLLKKVDIEENKKAEKEKKQKERSFKVSSDDGSVKVSRKVTVNKRNNHGRR